MNNFIDNINPELSFRINQIMVDSLDRRKYIYDKMEKIVYNIVADINNSILFELL